jgi:hypothetical protein
VHPEVAAALARAGEADEPRAAGLAQRTLGRLPRRAASAVAPILLPPVAARTIGRRITAPTKETTRLQTKPPLAPLALPSSARTRKPPISAPMRPTTTERASATSMTGMCTVCRLSRIRGDSIGGDIL